MEQSDDRWREFKCQVATIWRRPAEALGRRVLVKGEEDEGEDVGATGENKRELGRRTVTGAELEVGMEDDDQKKLRKGLRFCRLNEEIGGGDARVSEK